MDPFTQVPAIWDQLAETMYLKDSPTASVNLSRLAPSSYGRFQSTKGLPDIARPIVGERGYIIPLQLKPIPFIEQFLGNERVSSGSYPLGGVSAIRLQDEPACFLPNPFDTLVLYITQASLDEVAYAHRSPCVENLSWPHGTFDPIVHHIGQALLFSLEQPDHASKVFLDYVLQALNCHFVRFYGGVTISPQQFRGGLSPWQKRRATEFLVAHLDGNIPLQRVAEECEMSVSHFARAFKSTFRRPPHMWLTERRVERAKDLMRNSRLPLADIADWCGFADQSALNRSFKRIDGTSPGAWRRQWATGSNGPSDVD